MIKQIIFLTLIIGFDVVAAAGTKDATEKPILEVTTVYGSKTTHIAVVEKEGKSVISMVSNEGDSKERILTSKDVEFLKSEFKKLPNPIRLPNECARSKLKATLIQSPKKFETKESCLGQPTATEPAYVKFSQILVNAL